MWYLEDLFYKTKKVNTGKKIVIKTKGTYFWRKDTTDARQNPKD